MDPNRPHNPFDAYGTHIRGDCTTMKGIRSWRHANVCHALAQAFKASGGARQITLEPAMADLYNRVPPAPGAAAVAPNERAARADVLAYCNNPDSKRLVIDATIVGIDHTSATVGAAIRLAARNKIAKYQRDFQIDQSELKIFGMDHTGRLAPEARGIIKLVAECAASMSGCPGDYGRIVTDMYQRVAIAAQKGNAKMLSSMLSLC